MDNCHGDLADILGSSIGPVGGTSPSSAELSQVSTTYMWQFNQSHISPMKDHSLDDFGNPFCTLIKDPLFEDLDDIPISALSRSSNIFTSSSNITQESATTFPDDDKYSTMIQIAPKLLSSSDVSCCTNTSRLLKPLAPNHKLICNYHINHMMISGNSSRGSTSNCFIENRRPQISSPQYTSIKRRKGQAKKVVCIPAPAPAPVNSRPTGEIVPSDLWAWRKYGQKPIIGSPYPRGYYRCSSSKGCSARKQVERSRTDPNMLVITYTSEHNHPWPTQRNNALAGSTRNQFSKNIVASASRNSPGSNESRKSPLPSLKEEHKDMSNNNVTANNSSKIVKDEKIYVAEKETGMEDGGRYSESYRPALVDSINHPDKDFYAELGEIEADPLVLMFTRGFTGEEESESHKALDPYGLL